MDRKAQIVAINRGFAKFPTKTNAKSPFLDDPIMKAVKRGKYRRRSCCCCRAK